MNDWSPERRALVAVGLVGLGIVIGFALDGGADRTVIVNPPPAAPRSPTTGPAATTPASGTRTSPTATGTQPKVFRQPRTGEG